MTDENKPITTRQAVAAKERSGKMTVSVHTEPSAPEFEKLLADLGNKLTVVTYADLDHHPKVLGALLKHVKNTASTGKLVIVSKAWNADNTDREIELRKSCLFYQQNVAKPPKKG